MKGLLRLYPRSWRKRYGPEMEDLVDQSPGGISVALDLLIGAAVAYRDVIRANRILSAGGAYLHGLCVAVLLQAIAFVSMILFSQRTYTPTDFSVGGIDFATVVPAGFFLTAPRAFSSATVVVEKWVPEILTIAILFAALAVVLATPRLIRRLR